MRASQAREPADVPDPFVLMQHLLPKQALTSLMGWLAGAPQSGRRWGLALGVIGEAETAAAVLGHNFPDSPWYKDAFTLLQSRGLAPRESGDSWITKAFKSVGMG